MTYLQTGSPALKEAKDLAADYGLENQGLRNVARIYWNLADEALYEEVIFRGEGRISKGGPLHILTGIHTARAAADKFVVREDSTEEKIWWGQHNRPFGAGKFSELMGRVRAYCQGRDLFVQDCCVGADPEFRMNIRVITEKAWQSLFARNVFLTTGNRECLKRFIPDFTIISVPDFKADSIVDGTRSSTAIIINFEQRLAIIANSLYGGEIKKSIFTVLNYLLTFEDVLPMHCSANVGKEGDVALFFGLSGTGKTTLSVDPMRNLIGDDEHGWSESGIFNFEGGCYAKVIRLSESSEPEIFSAIQRFGAILENVAIDPITRRVDLDDDRITENTRSSFPIEFVPKVIAEGYVHRHPKNIIFLTCDATGVMPPIARLNVEQAQYHFINGYTSKIAGTEIGLGCEPEITFSACFGAPFMVRHPFKYAEMLKRKMSKHGTTVWLVNTGWVGGRFGVGKRISIRHTRNLLSAVLDGSLANVEFRKDKVFGFEVPTQCKDVPDNILDPSNSWGNKEEYWKRYQTLAKRFAENYQLFERAEVSGIMMS